MQQIRVHGPNDVRLDDIAAGNCLVFFKVNTDWEWPHDSCLPLAGYFETFIVDLGFKSTINGVKEVFTMITQMKTEKIISK